MSRRFPIIHIIALYPYPDRFRILLRICAATLQYMHGGLFIAHISSYSGGYAQHSMEYVTGILRIAHIPIPTCRLVKKCS